MKQLFLVVLAVAAVVTDDLPPSCSKRVYCNSSLLHHVQMATLEDSKKFVDLSMRNDENTTLSAFQKLLDNTNDAPTPDQLNKFVTEYFTEDGELEDWTPNDYSQNPEFLNNIRDKDLREFAKNINDIWPILGRRVKPAVFEKPDQFSFIPVSNGFIVPGGRFKEIYYWDAYWIIEGLLISGMTETAKGMIENLIELLNKIGHIPNGSRWYYQERSQPPLLSAMMLRYYEKTKDMKFLKKHIGALEKEMNYWLDTHIVTFSKDDRVFTLLRYYAPSAGPRPESYAEDYKTAQNLDPLHDDHTEFYIDIKSAAESGWDFSTRWFVSDNGDNSGNLTNIHTRYIIPVDLNAIFANALKNLATFYSLTGNSRRSTHWAYRARQWIATIEEVLWHEEDGIWYDYDIQNEKHRRYFYPSNLAPLWMPAVDDALIKSRAPRVIYYLKHSQGLDYPGGIPVSLSNSNEQWDFPNVWPPEVSVVIKALQATGTDDGEKLAFHLAQEWVRICRKGFQDHKQMFEKYDANNPGRFGAGGEYTVQEGFGWSNGVVLECLDSYGEVMTAYESTNETNEELKVLPLQDEKKNEKKTVPSGNTETSSSADSSASEE